MEAVILAGGTGTRLRERVADRPKPMALVSGRPFLDYVLRSLERVGVRKVVLAVSYMGDVISEHYGSRWESIDLDYSVEAEPLGTGGAFRQAMERIQGEWFWALNGDSLLATDFGQMKQAHDWNRADLTIALREVDEVGRYGAVEWESGRVLGFSEKGARIGPGLINGGVYLCEKRALLPFPLGTKFSFEKDILEAKVRDYRIWGVPSEGFFIDIGVPEDFDRAQTEPYLKELIP